MVDNPTEYKLLTFMYAYFRYKQIPMFGPNIGKTKSMNEQANYQYNMMPFGLKNTYTGYQRMINKVFQEEIGENIEVYMDNMTVESNQEESYYHSLCQIFKRV